MRLRCGIRASSVAGASFLLLVAVLVSASCGSKSSLRPGEAVGGSSDGGDDATTPQCFGACSAGSPGSFNGGSGLDSGPINVVPVDADIVKNECPGALAASMVTALQSASANTATIKWLYPYDRTVFPGGLAGPVLQWSQTGTPDGVYLHLHSNKFDFKGCYKAPSTSSLPIDDATWATAYAQSGGKSDPLTVELSTVSGGTASAATKETWIFARGSLAGDVYYNTYDSKLVPGQTNQNGAVMRIENGKAEAVLYTANGVTPFGPCVASATTHRLDQASGYDDAGVEYLPFPGRDENLDFYPTVAPISTGGYFWTYFTSRRAYGNVYPGLNGQGAADVGTKAIWVSAIDIGAPAGTDPSHPAFYLPGQELGSGNIRAFAVLAPCKGDGSSCESGLDCCGGSCTSGKCGVPTSCAQTNDRCSPTVPCCNSGDQCLGGYCGFIEK